MKIRLGFVSNSSSSSFILRVDMSKDNFIEEFRKEFYNSNKNLFMTELTNEIKELEETISKYQKELESVSEKDEKQSSFTKFCIDRDTNKLSMLKNTLENLSGMTENDATIEQINHKGARIEDKGHCIKLHGFTSMYNSFEDVPEIMRDILAMCAYKNIHCDLEVISKS